MYKYVNDVKMRTSIISEKCMLKIIQLETVVSFPNLAIHYAT